jgi:hypothetical protein
LDVSLGCIACLIGLGQYHYLDGATRLGTLAHVSVLCQLNSANALDQGGFNASGLGAAFFVVLAGIGFFFNHFLVFKLRDKMFGQPGAEATAAETPAEAE